MTTNETSPSFVIHADGVDPKAVPFHTLYTGATMPAVGLGTFGSDHATGEEVANAVVGAAEVGYRHFDCAAVYGNETLIGAALAQVMRSGVKREELWITSKLWNDMHAEHDVIPAFHRSLNDLGLEYLDLYLIHWPFPNWHKPGCDVSSRSPDAKPYIHENFMKTWRQLEKLQREGLVRHLGTSNMTIPKLKLVLRDAEIKPAVNELELHPHFQQSALFAFLQENKIVPVGYSPIGSPNRPERDRMPDDTVDIEDPVIVEIARKHNTHPVAVCLKWSVQRGAVPIPMSTKRKNYLANLKAVTTDPLSDDEMAAIATIDRNCRLIKGHVFLWKEGQRWEDLWDVDGVIPS